MSVPRRPGALTAGAHDKFLEELGKGLAIKHAARNAGLNPGTVSGWIARGRGHIPDRKPTPEYVAFVESIEQARSQLIGKLARSVIDGATNDPIIAMKVLDRLDPNWMESVIPQIAEPPPDEDEPAFLGLPSGEPLPVATEVTLHERTRTVSIPVDRMDEFSRLLRGKDPKGADDRLDRFRETAGDVPPT